MANHHNMKSSKEWEEKPENQSKFNSVTQKSEPENQNQTHNVKREGISKINQNR